MAQPIFVVGRNRSGTKWLSNILANHSDIACVQHERSGGILETNAFRNCPDVFGDLSINDNYYGFLAFFLKSNFFRCSGLAEEVLYEKRFTSYFAFFRFIMDKVAEREQKGHWLQKSDSLLLPTLLEHYPDAKFIVIRRLDVRANVSSSLVLRHYSPFSGELKHDITLRAVLRELLSYYLHQKTEEYYRGRPNLTFVTYEDLLSDKKAVIERLCEILNLPFQEAILEDIYLKNTSFGVKTKREEILTKKHQQAITLLSPTLKALPVGLFRIPFVARRKLLQVRTSEARFVPGTFRLYREEAKSYREAAEESAEAQDSLIK